MYCALHAILIWAWVNEQLFAFCEEWKDEFWVKQIHTPYFDMAVSVYVANETHSQAYIHW